ncbi:MAG: hypothetical protein R2762_24185 [Bryobacteraceae bacterium]
MVETLGQDLPENIFQDAASGYALRFIFGHVRQDQGPVLLLYQLIAPETVRKPSSTSARFLGFDHSTQLLNVVTYKSRRGNRDVAVESRFDQWADRQGRKFPGLIRRREDGKEVFSFIVTESVAGGRLPDTAFRQ